MCGRGCSWALRYFQCWCRCDCVYGCVGVVLAVNGGAMEGRNMNNYCTPSITEAMFYWV